MAITLTNPTPVAQGVDGRVRWKVWQINGPASYATGGTTFSPSEVGMSRIFWTEAITPLYNGTLLTEPQFPPVAANGDQNMILMAGAAAGAGLSQITAATNMAAYTGLIKVYGT